MHCNEILHPTQADR